MSTPYEFNWRLWLPEGEHTGVGLIPAALIPLLPRVDRFEVYLPDHRLIIRPVVGSVHRDDLPVYTSAPGELLVFRRMEFTLGTAVKHKAAPKCKWYWAGIRGSGFRVGMKITEDGKSTCAVL